MPSMLYSKALLGGIPSPGTTCSRAWNKVFQPLEQVIEGTPLFEPLNFGCFSFSYYFQFFSYLFSILVENESLVNLMVGPSATGNIVW
jgi:hypothetical protein